MKASITMLRTSLVLISTLLSTPMALAGHLVGGDEIGTAVMIEAPDVACQTADTLQRDLLAAAGRSAPAVAAEGHDLPSCRTALSLCLTFSDWGAVQPFFMRAEQKLKASGIDAVINILGSCDKG